ncbi:ABC transporter permease [Metabacillus sp. RGM 3146]|uniref:ABC transporter permease n=1 Tax=Metabacillus sp. RGM 3146 TaxID=3401092 RepID=UPI003B9BE332
MKSLKNTALKPSASIADVLKRLIETALPGIAILLLLLFWELAVRFSGIDKWILPAPTEVIKALFTMSSTLPSHIIQTVSEAILGLVISIVAGVLFGTIIDLSDWIRKAIYPLLIISQTIPIIALAPLFIIWFGFGLLPKVLVVALVCFFPIAINLADGYRLVDRDMLKLMKTFGATKRQTFLKVKFPSALPFFFSGLKIAGTYSVMGAVIGEWLGSDRGLGIVLTRSSQSFLTEKVFATILIIVLLSLAVFALIEILARICMPWRYEQQKFEK